MQQAYMNQMMAQQNAPMSRQPGDFIDFIGLTASPDWLNRNAAYVPFAAETCKFPRGAYSKQDIWERRLNRIASKKWDKRLGILAEWAWKIGAVWGLMIASAVTIWLSSWLLALVIGG
jgi:hypothetical protein